MTINYESFSLQVSDFSVLVQGPNPIDNETNEPTSGFEPMIYYWLI
jgi:hypothetical protein